MSHSNAKAFCGKNILITGGLGFIGSAIARKLVDFEAKVTLVDSMIPEYGGNLFNIDGIEDRVQVNFCDVRDRYAFQYLVKDKDYLFNLAGQTSHIDSMSDPFTDLDINAKAQLSILEACRVHNPNIRIVFASTRQVYGKPDYFPVDEHHPLRPVDVNGINKLSGEWYHTLYNKVYGIRASVLRLTNTYGPGMRVKDARQTFLGIWIKNLLQKKPFEVWGGNQLRDFTYVDDVVSAACLCASTDKSYGKVFNVGGNQTISLGDLAKLLVSANDGGTYNIIPFPEDRKRIDIGDYIADDSLIREMLEWSPRTSLADGLKSTLDFYRKYLPNYL